MPPRRPAGAHEQAEDMANVGVDGKLVASCASLDSLLYLWGVTSGRARGAATKGLAARGVTGVLSHARNVSQVVNKVGRARCLS